MNNPKSYKNMLLRVDAPTPLRFLSPIHKATRQLSLYLERNSAESGISNPEAHLLAYLLSYGPCSVGQLLAVFGHKKSTLTSILDRLEDRKFVLRTVNPQDRRSFLVALTEAGGAAAQRIRSQLETLETEIASLVSERSLTGFNRVMQAIATVTSYEPRSSRASRAAPAREKTAQGKRPTTLRKEKP
jgi:DNA-binding MarR family transcriptional regulator